MNTSPANGRIHALWNKYHAYILSVLLALYTLPVAFSYYVSTALDGSWIRGVNMAVKDNIKFGSGIVFTYGPLGYLATRNSQYVHNSYMFLADMFLLSGFVYLFYRCLSQSKGWFIILLVALFYYKGTDYSAALFLVYISVAILNLKHSFNNYFELVFCAIAGVLLFFIKINYGLIALFIHSSLLLFLLFKNRKSLLLFSLITIAVFTAIYLKVNIDIPHYIRYSIPTITGYDEGMSVAMPAYASPFMAAVLLFLILLSIFLYFFISLPKARRFDVANIYPMMLLALMFFLIYKNGFVRYDDGHVHSFFAVVPLLIIFTIFLLKLQQSILLKIVCVTVLFITDYNTTYETKGKGFIYSTLCDPLSNYASGILKKQDDVVPPSLKMAPDKLKLLGRSTVDIFPIDISIVQLNNLNYDPRPVIQSYAAYTSKLDEINADHFRNLSRPEYVLINTWSIDNRYPSWDESLTKATIRLNYEYAGHISLHNDSLLTNDINDYLLLKSKKGGANYPQFVKLYDKEINFGDTLHINFPGNIPVYMTADIQYTTLGKIEKILYQPATINVSQFFDSACATGVTNRIVRSEASSPVLINKYIAQNTDFINFITGCLQYDKDVRAFTFVTTSPQMLRKNIKISFMKLANY